MALISIVIPMYNAEKFIGKCLDSLTAQTYSDIEIIVVDDASSDGSVKVVEKIAAEDSRVHLIYGEKGNAATTRNTGMKCMRGEFFTFVDADDYVDPDYIQKMADRMNETGADLVVTGFKNVRVQEDGTCVVESEKVPEGYVRFTHEETLMRFGETVGKLFRRTLLDKYKVTFINGGEGAFGEDMPFYLFYYSMCDKIEVLPASGYYYVHHGASTMAAARKKHNLKIPYAPLEEIITKIASLGGPVNGKDYYEWYVMRILCTYIDLTRGAGSAAIRETAEYIRRIISTYFPNVKENRLVRLSAKVDVPKSQQMAVAVMVRMYRMKMLKPFLNIYCRLP